MTGTRINLIGGNAYSATGGIQAMNRVLVRELGAAGLLRRAFFLWDTEGRVSAEGSEARRLGHARFYGMNRWRMVQELFWQGLRFPRDLWLCTHVNYTLAGLGACLGDRRRLGVLLHAEELDRGFTPRKAWALRRAGYVLAVSEYTRKKAVRLGVAPARVHVLPNAVERVPPVASRPPADPAKSTHVLFVGRMDERYKGQMELLDAMVLLRRRRPGLRLVFVGGGGSLPRWKERAARLGLTDTVEFRGRLSEADLAQAYETAAIFAMPSENEGFGLVYAEAMARGLACVGSDRDAAGEVIAHGETGLLVPAGNATALADAILDLTRDRARLAEMGRAGLRRYLEHYTPEKYRLRLCARLEAWRRQAG